MKKYFNKMELKKNNDNNILVINIPERSLLDDLLLFSIGILLGLLFSSSNINNKCCCNSDDESDDSDDSDS